MSANYDYRLMLPGQEQQVDRLARVIFPGDEMLDGTIRKALDDASSNANYRPRYWLAFAGEEMVGFSAWNWSWINYDVAEFAWCGVLKEHRGRGIGRKLVEVRLDDIRDADPGMRMVLVNTGSPHIYRRYGFETLAVCDWRNQKNNHVMRLMLDTRESCI